MRIPLTGAAEGMSRTMLNTTIGSPFTDNGRTWIRTPPGSRGHALYGPYEFLNAGSYVVEFQVDLAADQGVSPRGNPVCAVLDVARKGGNEILVSRQVRLADLKTGQTRFRVNFSLERRSRLEYRVWTSGKAALDISVDRRIEALDARFPSAVAHLPSFDTIPPVDPAQPVYFQNNRDRFEELHRRGFKLVFFDNSCVLSRDDISFFVRCDDDLNFVQEVFDHNVYNFIGDQPTCAIDIGMNIGFSSLQFARKACVEEVFAFEPFEATYRRAIDNLGLNPHLSSKIKAACVGLSDKNWSGDIGIGPSTDSGSGTVVGATGDRPVSITLADAAAVLEPILVAAREKGRRTVVKVDCEGSEFAIFETLRNAQLFQHIDALMVEWHAMFEDLNQVDLFAPLLSSGFMIFDQSPRAGNGFFYAVRMAPATA